MSLEPESLREFFISIPDHRLVVSGTPEGLLGLALRAFALAEEYPASTSGILPGVPGHILVQQFAVVHFPAVKDGDPEFHPINAILHQNPPSRPERVVVDFQTRTAVCEGQEASLAIEPEQIKRALEWIKGIMGYTWRSNRTKKKAHVLKKHVDWKKFLQRLESGGILPDNPYPVFYSSSLHRRCPLCDIQTERCSSCHSIMCLNRTCAVSKVIPFQTCSRHDSTSVCSLCIADKRSSVLLLQCPQCSSWYCGYDLTWCNGRPKDWSNRSQDPHDVPRYTIPAYARVHPPRPIGCPHCLTGQDQPRCANRECWSIVDGNTRICELCRGEGGIRCACGRWLCDACRASPLDNTFKECPRCKRTYCPDVCRCIGSCGKCGRSTLCDECFEEDWGRSATDVVAAVLKGKCGTSDCKKKKCETCLRGTQCAECGKAICTSCTVRPGDGYLCKPCYERERKLGKGRSKILQE